MFAGVSKSTRVLLAFASVYLCWGSTYLAIHVAGEHLPTPVVSGTRSLVSCLLIVAIALARGQSLRVPRDEVWKLIVVGILFMSFNNMGLTWGEKMVPSGFASLVISMMPIMIALLEMLLGGESLNRRGWAGTLLATLGIGVLVWPAIHAQLSGGRAMAGFSRPVLGTLVLLGAALSFAVGAVLSRRFQFKADTFVATGWQIGAAAIFNLSLAGATGGLQRAVWSWRGFGAIVYLSVFGSLIGLVAFTYLLKNVAVTKVSTYAFVNPVIAVLLGVLVLHERLAPVQLAGMAVIVCGVAMVIYSRVGRGKQESAGAAGLAAEQELDEAWKNNPSRAVSTRRLRLLVALSLVVALGMAATVALRRGQFDESTIGMLAHTLAHSPRTDSTMFMRYGEAAFRAPGHSIYTTFFVQHQKFIYPPSSLFLMEMLDALPGKTLQDIVFGAMLLGAWLGILVVGVFFYRSVRKPGSGAGRGVVSRTEVCGVLLLGVLYMPVDLAYFLGQVQLFLTLCFGVGALLWCRRRYGLAGFVLGLCCVFKPQMALFVLWGAWRRNWRFTAAFAGAVALIEVCAVAHFGVANNLDYVRVLRAVGLYGETFWPNQSLNGLLNRLLGNGDPLVWSQTAYPAFNALVYRASMAFAGLLVLAGLVLPGRRWRNGTADYLLFGGLATLASPIVWPHHYGVFFFLLLYLLARSEELTIAQWWLLVAAQLLMANPSPAGLRGLHRVPSLLGNLLFYAGLVVLGLLAAVASRRASGESAVIA